VGFEMPQERSLDIDTADDFLVFENCKATRG
jgi:CMP-N-acetylneuraminic acid synthetase